MHILSASRRGAALAALPLILGAATANAQQTRAPFAWPAIDREARPWTRWWWMGSAVTREGISAELRQLHDAGFGGVEITAIYGVRGAESAAVPYLSPRWVALLQHTIDEARRLGMAVDLPQGSGWRMGGPFVAAADVNASLRLVPDSTSGDANRPLVARIVPSGDRVKRPAPGNEGPAIDVFSRRAVDRYLHAIADRLTVPRGALRSYFHDSFEYTGDASPELLDSFRRRRGYDLRHELDALAGRGDADRIARVKSDYRQTLDEMLLDNFVRPLTAWSHARGSLMREQAHGSPANLLDLYGATDIPETEIFGPLGGPDADPLVNKFASSAAHVAGRRLASAEAFTWMGEHWNATLDEAKRAADRLFLAGINHLVYHGTAYSPADAAWPGWEFYASSEFNPRNAWWHDLPAFNAYVARVQSVLQQEGARADEDVLLYWPIWDNWHDTSGVRMDFRVHDPKWLYASHLGEVARRLWGEGYGFDYVSDRQLATEVSARRRALRGGRGDYTLLVVPVTEHMPPETFERIVALAREGATVGFLGGVPADVPGLAQLEERRARLRALGGEFAPHGPTEVPAVRRVAVGRGTMLVASDVGDLLRAAGVVREPLVDAGVRFLRRRRAGGFDYFVSNDGRDSVTGFRRLSVRAASVALLDPMTGRAGLVDSRRDGEGTSVQLDLAPGETRIVRTFDAPVTGPRWNEAQVAGAATSLRGPWSVGFLRGGPALPASFASDSLVAWTARGDSVADRFAGTARYTLRFDAPSDAPDFVLDLGRVAESARVRLNGMELGVLFARPFSIHTGRLSPRDNLLEIDVTNVSANRIRDLDRRGVPWKIFHDINYVNIDYKPFDASHWPVRTAGLLGPVTLTPLRRVPLAGQ